MRTLTRKECAVVWGFILVLWATGVGLNAAYGDNPLAKPTGERKSRYPYYYPKQVRLDTVGIDTATVNALGGQAVEQIHIDEFRFVAQDVLDRTTVDYLQGNLSNVRGKVDLGTGTDENGNTNATFVAIAWYRTESTDTGADSVVFNALGAGDQFLIHDTTNDNFLFGTFTGEKTVTTCPERCATSFFYTLGPERGLDQYDAFPTSGPAKVYFYQKSGVVGEAGEQGPQGPQGEKGDKGDTGDAGATGPQGPQGEKGDKGDTGDAGATGPQGPQGEKGDKGDTGDAGATGPQGPQGDKGDKGDTGDAGATGPQGPQGEKGDKGDTGDAGATGPQGPQGEKGDKGDTGAQGPAGPAGSGAVNTLLTDGTIENADTMQVFENRGITVGDLFAFHDENHTGTQQLTGFTYVTNATPPNAKQLHYSTVGLNRAFSVKYTDNAERDRLKAKITYGKRVTFLLSSSVYLSCVVGGNPADLFGRLSWTGNSCQEAGTPTNNHAASIIVRNNIPVYSDFAGVAFSGDYDDLTNKPTIPAAQVQADWSETDNTQTDFIKNKPTTLFDLHDDVTAENKVVADADRFLVSDESVSGDPNEYVRADSLASYIKQEADIAEVEANPSDNAGGGTLSKLKIDGTTYAVSTAPNTGEENVQADWDETNTGSDAFIKNKPTIPAAQVQADWSEADNTQADFIKNKPTTLFDLHDDVTAENKVVADADRFLVSDESVSGDPNEYVRADSLARYVEKEIGLASVATSGSYNDLSNLPTIPTVPARAGAFTQADETKLDGIATGAEVNVQSDWNQTTTTADDYIENKPTIPTVPARAGAFTQADETKLDGIAAGAEVNVNADWNASSGDAQILNKPTIPSGDITGVTAGTGLSGGGNSGAVTLNVSNPFTDTDETKLDGIATGAEVNVQSDWNQTTTTADDYIENKPTIPTVPARAGAFTQADETKLDGIAAGAEVNVNADWNASSGDAQILNKPTIPSGDITGVTAGTGLSGGGNSGAVTLNVEKAIGLPFPTQAQATLGSTDRLYIFPGETG